MKYTLLLTQDCNLRCTYCYIGKNPARMSIATAEKLLDFIFKHNVLNKGGWLILEHGDKTDLSKQKGFIEIIGVRVNM